MEGTPKELRAAAEAIYAKGPPADFIRLYGGDAADYLPEIEISSATVKVYQVFVDLETQWRVNGMNGFVSGLDYSAVPFVLACHGVENSQQILRDLRVMEAAAVTEINKRES